jgi:thymidylate synthase ThyX
MGALNLQHYTEATQAAGRLGVHKQLANRLLEPFSWHTVVVTATDWDNFFHLRCHPDAQPEFQKIAGMMRDVMEASTHNLYYGEWHLPYITRRGLVDRTMDSTWKPGGLLARISLPVCQGELPDTRRQTKT